MNGLIPGRWPLWAGLTLLLWLGEQWYLSGLQPGPLSLQLSFTPQRFGAVLHFWSAEQLLRYRHTLWLDPGLLLCGVLAALGYARQHLAQATPLLRTTWHLLLCAAVAVQLATTLAHGWLTAVPRFGLSGLYALVAALALLKWLLLAVALVVLLWQRWQQQGEQDGHDD